MAFRLSASTKNCHRLKWDRICLDGAFVLRTLNNTSWRNSASCTDLENVSIIQLKAIITKKTLIYYQMLIYYLGKTKQLQVNFLFTSILNLKYSKRLTYNQQVYYFFLYRQSFELKACCVSYKYNANINTFSWKYCVKIRRFQGQIKSFLLSTEWYQIQHCRVDF